MPTPNPSKETRKQFLERCVPIVIDEKTAKDGKQGYAICISMWEEHMKKKRKTKGEKIVEGLKDGLKKNA